MRYDYRNIKTERVEIKGIPCEFYDMRIDRTTVPEGKFVYEVAGDDDSGGDPTRIRKNILINFYGTIICDVELLQEEEGVFWLEDGDFKFV